MNDEELETLINSDLRRIYQQFTQKGLMLMKKLLGYTCMTGKIRCLKLKKNKKIFWGPDMIYLELRSINI